MPPKWVTVTVVSLLALGIVSTIVIRLMLH
jgi:hypothetical protein